MFGLATLYSDEMGQSSVGFGDFLFIGELSAALRVSPRAIRFYEKEGLVQPSRHGRVRVYRKSDEARVRIISELRKLGLPIAQIRDSLDLFLDLSTDERRQAAAATLERHCEELERRRSTLDGELALAQALLEQLSRPEIADA